MWEAYIGIDAYKPKFFVCVHLKDGKASGDHRQGGSILCIVVCKQCHIRQELALAGENLSFGNMPVLLFWVNPCSLFIIFCFHDARCNTFNNECF